jgi:hypothetical protein
MRTSDKSKQKKKILLVASSAIIIFAFIIMFYIIPMTIPPSPRLPDRFGTSEIYPSVQGGREWFINMQDPFEDEIISFNSDNSLVDQQPDGSWRMNSSQVRISVETLLGQKEWKNIEMTGYIKMISSTLTRGSSESIEEDEASKEEDSLNPHISWRARGGRHNDLVPCEGTALSGALYIDGRVSWKKEIWHTGGYTDARGESDLTVPLVNKWIGWKIALYNINNNSAVKMESYLDANANNNWLLVSEVEDKGGWYADASDEVFYSIDCGRTKDHIITNEGPIATFRADNLIFDFKNLSIREILPIPTN